MLLEEEFTTLDESQLPKIFAQVYDILQRTTKRSLTETEQAQALRQVLNYYRHNQHRLRNIYAAEYPVQVVHDDYVVNGKIDVLVHDGATHEVFAFKTNIRQDEDSQLFARYQQQLHFYALALAKNLDAFPLRLSLYWTAEEQRANAHVELAYQRDELQQMEKTLHKTITQMQQGQFTVTSPPERAVCSSCDMRSLCQREQIIQLE